MSNLFTFHAGFQDPSSSADAPERESTQVLCLSIRTEQKFTLSECRYLVPTHDASWVVGDPACDRWRMQRRHDFHLRAEDAFVRCRAVFVVRSFRINVGNFGYLFAWHGSSEPFPRVDTTYAVLLASHPEHVGVLEMPTLVSFLL